MFHSCSLCNVVSKWLKSHNFFFILHLSGGFVMAFQVLDADSLDKNCKVFGKTFSLELRFLPSKYSFSSQTSPSDGLNDCSKRLCLVSWAAVPCV